jgi:mRNA interferase MazF
MPFPKRSKVYLVNLDPTIGSEIKKTRPAVIIQNDVGNQYSPITIIAPITSDDKAVYPIEVEVKLPEGGLDHNSLILTNQIRAIDQKRLVKRLGQLSEQTMRKVDQAIIISLALSEL